MKPASSRIRGQAGKLSVDRILPEAGPQDSPPWEMVGVGRYMPRRIRGSFRGRELG